MKSRKASNFILIIMLLAGLCLLLYPTFSDWWNSFHQSEAVSDYVETIMNIDDDKYMEIWETARQFNEDLTKREDIYRLPKSMRERYNAALDVDGNGIMAYIDIDKLNVHLPIYHGTDDAILQVAIGHLDWTSLPVGGESTHCVISGHRGLPSAKLFTELDEMEIGDLFVLYVLDERLTYEVDQIKVVEPKEIKDLGIVEGLDLCTLVTCTPYGINSHRLLVRGHRVDNAPEVVERRVTADALYVEPMVVAGALLMPCVLLGVLGIFAVNGILTRSRKGKK